MCHLVCVPMCVPMWVMSPGVCVSVWHEQGTHSTEPGPKASRGSVFPDAVPALPVSAPPPSARPFRPPKTWRHGCRQNRNPRRSTARVESSLHAATPHVDAHLTSETAGTVVIMTAVLGCHRALRASLAGCHSSTAPDPLPGQLLLLPRALPRAQSCLATHTHGPSQSRPLHTRQ